MAEQENPIRRRVALKVIKVGMDTREVIARFEAERQALAMMDHPNIAKVLDAGATETGRPYFVMELVRGVKITKFCDQHRLPTAGRLRLFMQICRALQHAHQKGIIHRDLKPSNVLVTLHDGVPVPKVIDFGIAKATNGRLTDKTLFTAFEQFIGTPAYMSPEQAEMSGLDVDTRTDIYSLGVLLYELLTGRPPFDPGQLASAGLDEIRRRIREEEPPKPSTRIGTLLAAEQIQVAGNQGTESPRLVGLLRGDLDWIVMMCLEKDRSRRYETASGLAVDLERFLADEPVSARPPTAGYQFRKFARRHRSALGATALVAVVLVVATAVSTWQAVLATRATTLASERLQDSEQARLDAEAISGFMTEVFESPDPARDGRTITVAEKLDQAAEKLKTDLAGQARRRAKLQASLGRAYLALGLLREAIQMLETVRDYHLAASGSTHPDTITAMGDLANAYYGASRWEDALELQQKVVEFHRRANGLEQPVTIGAMARLALYEYKAGRSVEALKRREQVLELSRKVNGAEHPDTLAAMAELGLSYRVSGRGDEALKLFEAALPLSRKVNGPEHPATLDAMRNLARSYNLDGRHDLAIPMQEKVLALRREVCGPEHPDTLLDMGWLARSYVAVGRQDAALQMREEILKRRRKVLGPEHRDTLWAMANLADSYAVAGRAGQALTLREEVLPLRRKVSGPTHATTLAAIERLALSYVAAGRVNEARELRAELLALKRRVSAAESNPSKAKPETVDNAEPGTADPLDESEAGFVRQRQ
jgi:tetratricopeptide (TPR) repeat protein